MCRPGSPIFDALRTLVQILFSLIEFGGKLLQVSAEGLAQVREEE